MGGVDVGVIDVGVVLADVLYTNIPLSRHDDLDRTVGVLNRYSNDLTYKTTYPLVVGTGIHFNCTYTYLCNVPLSVEIWRFDVSDSKKQKVLRLAIQNR